MQPSEEIKSKLDIIDVLKDYIQLQQAGSNWRAKCPFHRENSPSFMVSREKQIWHCFGCGEGGDIFSFVQKIEGVAFSEALRILAPKAGVILKRDQAVNASLRNKVLDVLDLARRYYAKVLSDSQGADSARQYLERRGLNDEVIEEWQVGYSLNIWDGVMKILREKGFRDEEILQAGIAAQHQGTGRLYDRFRGRIMFPIRDINGNTVAFSARISPEFENKESGGKYINSPQSLVYDKSKILFGLDKARQEIKTKDQAIVVEGQMDVITAHQFGYKNVIASSGTALTEGQIKLIKRYTNNIALSFDMDAAGQMAAERGIMEAMRADLQIKVILLPGGKDPDECIRRDVGLWQQSLENAKSAVLYFFDKKIAAVDLNKIENKRQVVKELLPIVALIPNKIEQDYWLKILSEKVGVEEMLIRETLLANMRSTAANRSPRPAALTTTTKKDSKKGASDLFFSLLIKFPFLLESALKNVHSEYILNNDIQSLYNGLLIYYNKFTDNSSFDIANDSVFSVSQFREWLKNDFFINNPPVEISNQLRILDSLVVLAEKEYSDVKNEQIKNEFLSLSLIIKKNFLQSKMKEIEKNIIKFEASNNEKKVEELMMEFKLLSLELNDLK